MIAIILIMAIMIIVSSNDDGNDNEGLRSALVRAYDDRA